MIDKGYIEELVNKKLEGTEQFLVEIKLSPSRIAVFIDKPTGILINECAEVSRYLYNELEGKSLLETHELEVSSPGMTEPLKVYKQYQRRIGKQLRVIDNSGIGHTGILKSADANGFSIDKIKKIKEGKKSMEQKEEETFSYADIKNATLVF